MRAKRGLISAESLQKLKGPNGFKNVQTDLQILVHVFRANWANVTGKCATTETELARAEKLVSWLIQAVGLREQGPAEIAKSADLRVRAFTAFSRAYSDVRRAIAYVRWNEGDVDTIIPSLYQGRGGRKKETAPTGEGPFGSPSTTSGEGTVPEAVLGAPTAASVPQSGASGSGAASNGASAGGPFVR